METLQNLLKKIVVLIPIILFAGLLWWLVGKLIPNYSPTNIFSFYKGGDILPPPGSLGNFKKPEVPNDTTNLYVSSTEYNSNGNTYSKYNINNRYNLNNKPIINNQHNYSGNVVYMRNLSIANNSILFPGMIVRGEVKSDWFYNGSFPVLIQDAGKHIYLLGTAKTSDNIPAKIGWVNFQVLLGAFPVSNPCTMIFINNNQTGDKTKDVSVTIPVICAK
jgi:hypothetical protein